MKKKSKKKYDLFSIMIVVVTLILLGIGALLFGSFGSEFGEELVDTADSMGENPNYDTATDFVSKDTKNFADNYFFWFVVASFIGIILTGLFLEFEPVTMIILFVIGLIVVAFAYLGSSIYTGFQEDVEDSEQMSKTNVILNNSYFPILILVFLIIMVVVMYNRKRGVEV